MQQVQPVAAAVQREPGVTPGGMGRVFMWMGSFGTRWPGGAVLRAAWSTGSEDRQPRQQMETINAATAAWVGLII